MGCGASRGDEVRAAPHEGGAVAAKYAPTADATTTGPAAAADPSDPSDPTPSAPLRQWSPAQVGAWMRSIGSGSGAYEQYARTCVDGGIDGEFLVVTQSLPEEQRENRLRDLFAVDSPLHRQVILLRLAKIVEAQNGVEGATITVAPTVAAGAETAPGGATVAATATASAAGTLDASAAVPAPTPAPAPDNDLPAVLSNMPVGCAHPVQRQSLLDALSVDFSSAKFSAPQHCPVVALTGNAGTGKTELAIQFAQRELERASAAAGGEGQKPRRQLVWFFEGESGDSILRSYQQLAAALRVEWRAQQGEQESSRAVRVRLAVEAALDRYDSSLWVFDHAACWGDIEPFLPTNKHAGLRVLLTSVYAAVLAGEASLGRVVRPLHEHALTENRTWREKEALVIFVTSVAAGAAASSREDDVQLVRALELLPLAISAAGAYIASKRASDPSGNYGSRDMRAALQSHPSESLRLDFRVRGHADPCRSQAAAAQILLGSLAPPVRGLLDCAVLLGHCMPLGLAVHLYNKSVRAQVGGDAPAAAALSPKSAAAAAGAAVPDAEAEAADLRRLELALEAACCGDLVRVDAAQGCLRMPRSLQLQLCVLAEVKQKPGSIGGGLGGGGGGGGAAAGPTGSPLMRPGGGLPALTRAASLPKLQQSGSSPLGGGGGGGGGSDLSSTPSVANMATLRASPSFLQLFKADKMSVILGGIEALHPAHPAHPTSVARVAPVLDAIVRLVQEAHALPMLHPFFAALHKQLVVEHAAVALQCLDQQGRQMERAKLAASAAALCTPGSEAAVAMRAVESAAMAALGDAATDQ